MHDDVVSGEKNRRGGVNITRNENQAHDELLPLCLVLRNVKEVFYFTIIIASGTMTLNFVNVCV